MPSVGHITVIINLLLLLLLLSIFQEDVLKLLDGCWMKSQFLDYVCCIYDITFKSQIQGISEREIINPKITKKSGSDVTDQQTLPVFGYFTFAFH